MQATQRYYTLRIENYRPGPDDTNRTQFSVRGETVDEVLENIIWNTQPSFSQWEDRFRKMAHLHTSSTDAVLKRNELLPGQPMPKGCEYIYLYFRAAPASAP